MMRAAPTGPLAFAAAAGVALVLAPGAPAQGVADPAVEAMPISTPAPPALLSSAVVDRRGGRMSVRVEYRVPPGAVGTVPTAWRSFAGSRSARTLTAIGHGVTQVAVADGTYVFTARARMGAGTDRSGGFCVQPDFASIGLAPVQTACMTGTRARRASLTAHLPEVTVFGDSVAATFEWVPGTKEAMAGGLSVRFDLRPCRRLVGAPCPPNPPSALSTMRSMPGSVGDIAVINVGYNDWGASYDVPRVLRALRTRGVDRVVWVLLRPTQGSYRDINRQIRRAARRANDVQVADWGRYAARGSWFTADAVHLTTAGGWGLARFMRREVRKAVTYLRDHGPQR